MTDPQQYLVYAAEQAHSFFRRRRDFNSVEAAQNWANEIIGSNWFGRNWPHMAHSPLFIYESLNETECSAIPVQNIIDLTTWAYRKIIICHELSHLCNVDSEAFQACRDYNGLGRRKKRGLASHGKLFCGIYLKIVKHTLGEEAERELRRNFNLLGVKYDPSKWRKSRQRTRSNAQYITALDKEARKVAVTR